MHVTIGQALAFRVARHHLAERLGPKQVEDAAWVGLQDTPPGTAGLALAARADAAREALDELVLVPSIRGAPMAVAERDLAVFTAGLDPPAGAKGCDGFIWAPPNTQTSPRRSIPAAGGRSRFSAARSSW